MKRVFFGIIPKLSFIRCGLCVLFAFVVLFLLFFCVCYFFFNKKKFIKISIHQAVPLSYCIVQGVRMILQNDFVKKKTIRIALTSNLKTT